MPATTAKTMVYGFLIGVKSITCNGDDITGRDCTALAPIRKHIGVLFQSAALFSYRRRKHRLPP